MKINPDTFQPLSYLVFVKQDAVEEVTKGGIILSDTSQTSDEYQQQYGTITSMGPLAFTFNDEGERDLPNKPNIGDRIVYNKFAGQGRVFYEDNDGNKYRMLPDRDILGIVKE